MHNAFVRMNSRTIVMVFVRLRLSGMGVHCDHIVQFSIDFSLWMHSPMFLAPDTKACLPTPSHFQFHLEERWGMDVQTRQRTKQQMLIMINK